jgi:hypothetical protein
LRRSATHQHQHGRGERQQDRQSLHRFPLPWSVRPLPSPHRAGPTLMLPA